MSFGIAVTRDTILLVAPRVDITATSDDCRVSTPTGNLRDGNIRQGFDSFGTGFPSLIAMPQFTVLSREMPRNNNVSQ